MEYLIIGSSIMNCYSKGNCSATGAVVGGILGTLGTAQTGGNPIVKWCYSTGEINPGTKHSNVIGSIDGGTQENCWYFNTVEEGETKLAENKLGTSFVSDDSNINNGYPILLWQKD